jgi:hypothetical protein
MTPAVNDRGCLVHHTAESETMQTAGIFWL